jgi:hypothetical protein
MTDADEKGAGEETRHDPAVPHTAPFPAHVPRWLAWLLLAAFAASGVLCARAVLH